MHSISKIRLIVSGLIVIFSIAFSEMDANNVPPQFGGRVREVRKSQKLTQEELADKAGMHFTYIGQIERGKRNPSIKNVYRIAKALKVHSSKLLPF